MGQVVTFVDFSERKRLEEELNRLNDTLVQRVQEELKHNREKDHILIQQSRLAAMGEMMHNIAHQWRQPLNIIALIFSNILDEYDYQELTRDSLEKMVSEGNGILQQMSKTIDDFRDFFRPDRTPEKFEMSKSVKDAIGLIDATLKNNNINIIQSLESGLLVFGFSSQLAQVVLNILTNAREAILQRKVPNGRIEIRLQRAGDRVVLTIRDNGGGIPDEIIGRIFDPYFSTKEKGSGIGLYMSRMIIERNLNGTIQAENSDGGAVFTLSLPFYMEN